MKGYFTKGVEKLFEAHFRLKLNFTPTKRVFPGSILRNGFWNGTFKILWRVGKWLKRNIIRFRFAFRGIYFPIFGLTYIAGEWRKLGWCGGGGAGATPSNLASKRSPSSISPLPRNMLPHSLSIESPSRRSAQSLYSFTISMFMLLVQLWNTKTF